MSDNSKKSSSINPAGRSGGDRSGVEGGSEENISVARQRAYFNRRGELLTASIGTRFPSSLYKRYRDYAHFHHVNVRDLIAEAMQAYWDESLGKSYRARLKEAGQEELAFDDSGTLGEPGGAEEAACSSDS